MEAKELAEAISNFVASSGSDHKSLVQLLSSDHRTLQQSLFRKVIFPLIAAIAENECDLRNESTVHECRRIVEGIEKRWGSKTPPLPYI